VVAVEPLAVVSQQQPNVTEHPEIEELPDYVELGQEQRHRASMQNPPAWRAHQRSGGPQTR
jgi:hypothetical protein